MRKGEKRIVFLYILYLFCLFSNPAPCAPSSQNTLPPSLLLLLLVCGRCRFKNRKMIDFFCLLLLKLNNFRRQNFQVFFFQVELRAQRKCFKIRGTVVSRGLVLQRVWPRTDHVGWLRSAGFYVCRRGFYEKCLPALFNCCLLFFRVSVFFQLSNSFLTSSFLFNCKYHPNYNNISN